MNFYEKIFFSTYSCFARANTWDPFWSTISGLSILHVLNALTIGLMAGLSLEGVGKTEFVIISIILVGLLMWIHYDKLLKRQDFQEKAKNLSSKTKFWFGFLSLLYSMGTFGLFFWTLNAPWTPFILLCFVFIGVSLSTYLFKIKN